ncbi:MAG: hypothetical protein IPF93_16540 [Saprospiraceae bacterium]|nr:hypothetical protein [Saprospiraceae bacterium]
MLFVDDLVPEPNFCHELLSVIRKYPMVRAFAPLVFSYEDKSLLKVQYSKRYLKNKLYKDTVFQIEETISACLVFNKLYFYATGRFDPVLFAYARSTEDQELLNECTQER